MQVTRSLAGRVFAAPLCLRVASLGGRHGAPVRDASTAGDVTGGASDTGAGGRRCRRRELGVAASAGRRQPGENALRCESRHSAAARH